MLNQAFVDEPQGVELGAYSVQFEPRVYRVQIEKKDPITKEVYKVPMWREELQFNLTHTSGDTVCFKYHKHAGKWLWHDSRSGGVPEHVVMSEMARMLFHGSVDSAKLFVKACFLSEGME